LSNDSELLGDGSEIPLRSPPGMYKTAVNSGINCQPQLVSRISEPSTVIPQNPVGAGRILNGSKAKTTTQTNLEDELKSMEDESDKCCKFGKWN